MKKLFYEKDQKDSIGWRIYRESTPGCGDQVGVMLACDEATVKELVDAFNNRPQALPRMPRLVAHYMFPLNSVVNFCQPDGRETTVAEVSCPRSTGLNTTDVARAFAASLELLAICKAIEASPYQGPSLELRERLIKAIAKAEGRDQ